jgi:hypothetical protein
MKRLTWLVGPPGSGKSTWANTERAHRRVVEFNEMLAPLVLPARIRKGVLTANAALVNLVRNLEFHPDNRALPPLLVVVGLVPEDALFPLSDDEEVLLFLPERSRWENQLRQRPIGSGSLRQYDDFPYAEQWYDRFSTWEARGFPLRKIDIPFAPELIGRIAKP